MGPFTILHVADLHLSSVAPRNADRLASLDLVVDYAQSALSLIATVLTGDLFHQRSTVDDRNALAERLIALANVAPVAVCQGNHDEPEGLTLFSKLSSRWPIVVVTAPRVISFETPGPGPRVSVFVLPWPSRGGLVGAGVDHASMGQVARAALDPIFISAAAELAQADSRGDITLAIGHATVGGAVASTGQPQVGTGIEIDGALIARLAPRYVGLGHIHRHQVASGAVYAGSVARMDFSEREPKGFIEVEYTNEQGAWAHRWRFIDLLVPQMLHVDGTLTPAGFSVDSIDGDPQDTPPTPTAFRGADVRVRYAYKKSDIKAIDLAHIHALFAESRSLKLDPAPILEISVRAPEIATAKSLREKVEMYCNLNERPASVRALALLEQLQAQPPEEVLADVQARAEKAGAA